MNLFDSSFLCLDIGTYGVRGIAHRVRSARIDRSAYFSTTSFDTIYALKTVVDELEKQLGTHFDYAYITGNFGPSKFEMTARILSGIQNIKSRQQTFAIKYHKSHHLNHIFRCTSYHFDTTHQTVVIWYPPLVTLTIS